MGTRYNTPASVGDHRSYVKDHLHFKIVLRNKQCTTWSLETKAYVASCELLQVASCWVLGTHSTTAPFSATSSVYRWSPKGHAISSHLTVSKASTTAIKYSSLYKQRESKREEKAHLSHQSSAAVKYAPQICTCKVKQQWRKLQKRLLRAPPIQVVCVGGQRNLIIMGLWEEVWKQRSY